MSDVFGRTYSDLYDTIYAEKDYAAECEALENLFGRMAEREVGSVLDLGCGTGSHAVELTSRGYEVIGVDRSESMLEIARLKAGAGEGSRFVQGDVGDVDLGRRFDAVVSMFAVVGYQTSDEALKAMLTNARRHLEPGGIFVFDVWHGPAVLKTGPSDRFRVVTFPDGGELIRASRGILNEADRCCLVEIQAWELNGDRVVGRTAERHLMRYFFPTELRELLSAAGLEPTFMAGWPDMTAEPDEDTWNIVVAATAR